MSQPNYFAQQYAVPPPLPSDFTPPDTFTWLHLPAMIVFTFLLLAYVGTYGFELMSPSTVNSCKTLPGGKRHCEDVEVSSMWGNLSFLVFSALFSYGLGNGIYNTAWWITLGKQDPASYARWANWKRRQNMAMRMWNNTTRRRRY